MKKLLPLFLFFLLISCQKSESNNENKEEPKALQEKSIDIGRFKGREDLVDDLYQELVNKSPELKTLEDELNEVNAKDTVSIFHHYDNKSINYYISAKSNTAGIRDSILKNKILNLIIKSSDKYDSKKADIESLVTTINKKRTEITNYHTALKIVLTLPLIEQYQNDHLPKKSPFEKVIEKENQLLEKVKQNTPSY
ncbi:hypothetical protein [Flavobacterium sp. Root186]|uniref:hypothetical protein n=1 Tax=Flavobacterium sp. Root186 TaxID=1736485 RepID=UPI0006F4214B|nr:hypothetical protein [Flavobacterium sp. Root186]KRB55912.1 hypothetical protein ASD98_14805 [Flavobacterium sp. Root186]